MDISAALATDLAVLTAALETPGIDLDAGLQALTADLKRAVASYTGLKMTIALDGHQVSFTVHDHPVRHAATRPATSLLIPLAALTPTDASSTLLLYAATPGAFTDLAADLSYALARDPADLVLDAHLDPPAPSTGITGLDDHTTINQAIGVLIGRGHTPESAHAELHRLATHDHGMLRAAADAVIRTTTSEPTDPA